MSRYRKIEVKTWSDKRFRDLSPIPPSGQGLWFFLLTGPHTGPIPGLFRAGRASMAEELGWPQEAFDKAFDEVSVNGMAKADFKSRLVWLPNALKHNKPESPNVVRSWRVELDLLPECDLKTEAVSGLRFYLKSVGAPYVAAFDEFAPGEEIYPSPKPSRKASSKAMPNQEQEQEQEQEQKQERNSCAEPQSASPPEFGNGAPLIDLADFYALGGEVAAASAGPVPPAASPVLPVEPPVLVMPLVGSKEFGIMQGQIDEWVGAYPGVDVIRQLAAMRQWCLANPTRRKTQRGILAFCNSWLMREQDKAPARAAPAKAPIDLDAARAAANAEAKRRLGITDGRTLDARQ